ncbi:galactitol-1-phosphate 5-dehydrogenase [Tessaracoccus caeni]|uniref:galactitol-1-phosphate 5-dehydrogenase n=1 Tax=Tessaracoccus caeni TaxID=3031239 RepID=UPI0023DB374F|nr:galactitol-1-phosphate 5-dehydrogenase [Tessaracoccus caeni]MDF1489335.1 galactitol-1-phosphate 5-dehydrogenase [Tessaracoccus caeni]
MSSTMKTVAVTGIQELSVIPTPVPECGPTDVLVRVAYCGICGSDVPRYFDGGVHSFPQVLGHEFSGVVERVGSDVTRVSPGDRVAVAPLVPCHQCDECLAGRPALCPNYSFIGSRQQGALAEYVRAPEANVVPVGDLDLKVAALIEPLTVAIHGVERLPVEAGQDAAVLGGGVIGLMAVITLRAKGIRNITVVDVNPWALEMTKKFGATHTVNVAEQDLSEHFASIGAPQVVVETAGATPTRRQALEIAARNGAVVYIGTPTADLTLDPETFEHILRKELLVRGSWMSYSAPFPGGEWTQAPRLLADALGDPAEIVSHVFSLDEVADGFAVMRERNAHRLKVMFRVGGGQ